MSCGFGGSDRHRTEGKISMVMAKKTSKKSPAKIKDPASAVVPCGMKLDLNTALELFLPYPPVSGNNATRHAAGAHYRVDAAEAYRLHVLKAVRSAGLCVSLVGPLEIGYQLFPPDNRARDEDNALKEIKDALTKAEFWVDDSNKVIRKSVIEWGAPMPETDGLVIVTARGYEP